jgi:hypothetical protein
LQDQLANERGWAKCLEKAECHNQSVDNNVDEVEHECGDQLFAGPDVLGKLKI